MSRAKVGIHAVSEARRTIPALDGIRGLAIVLVLVYHQTLLPHTEALLGLDLWFARLAYVGWSGVDLFFVLSGFLITGILIDAKGQPHYFRNFYARRTLRIFPLYYAVVFLSLVVLPNLPEGVLPSQKAANFGRIEGDEIWYWLYLSNFAIANAAEWRHGILDISWSLAIEEQFYLVWPAVVASLSLPVLRRVCIGMMVLSLLVRAGMTAAGADPIAVYVLTPARLDPLAVGAFLAVTASDAGGLRSMRPAARRVVGAILPVLVAAWLWRGGLAPDDPVVQVVGFSLFALVFGALLVLAVTAAPNTTLARIFSHPVMRIFGKYSYALYLFHLPLRALIRDLWYGRPDFLVLGGSQLPGQLIFYGLATGLTLIVAMASWYLYESRFLALKRFFPSGAVRKAGKAGSGSSAGAGG